METTHNVHFGNSFLHQRSSIHSQDSLFSFRYAQKPHSLDTSSPGTISAVPTNPDSILASFPSTSSSSTNGNGVGDGKELWFTGQQVQTRDVDCVLVWDDALQSYCLERLDGSVKFAVERAPRSTLHHQPLPSTSTTRPPSNRKPASSPPNPRSNLRQSHNPNQSDSSSEDHKKSTTTRKLPGPRLAKPDEVEDFGSVSLLGAPPAVQPPSPEQTTFSTTSNAPIQLPSFTKMNKPISPPPPAPFHFPSFKPISNSSSSSKPISPPNPTPTPPKPTPATTKKPSPPSKPKPVAASKRPPEQPKPPIATKKPPASTAAAKSRQQPPPPKKSVPIPQHDPEPPRPVVGRKTIPVQFPSVSPELSGSDDDDSDEEEEESEEEEEEEKVGLVVPGSVLSRNAVVASSSGSHLPSGVPARTPGARAAKTIPSKYNPPLVEDNDDDDDDSSGDDSDSSSLEGVDIEALASNIEASLSGPSGGRRKSISSQNGGGGGKVGSVGRKGPAPSQSYGRVGSKGIARKGPAPPSASSAHWQQELEDDVPESSEEDD